MRTSTLPGILLRYLLVVAVWGGCLPSAAAQVSEPPVSGAQFTGGGGLTLSGTSSTCPNVATSFKAVGPCDSWNWDAEGGRIANQQDISGTSSTVTITWDTPGSYTVSVSTDCPGTSYASTLVTVAEPTPGAITTAGVTAQLSATSATICLGNTLQLVPPANSTNWFWSGANVTTNPSNGVATVQPVAENNTYLLTYTVSGSSCQATSTFVVNAVSAAGKVEALNNGPYGENWHYGTGLVRFAVKDPDPLRVYSWYDSPSSTTPVGTGASWTTHVTQSKSYYVSASLCQEQTPVPVLIRRVQLQVQMSGGATTPTGPVRLVSGTPLVLQASSQTAGALAWFRNGQQITSQSSASFAVTQVGRYTVRANYPGSSAPEDESQPVDVVSGLDGQSANGQALTYLSDTQVLKAGVASTSQVAQLATADRTQTITYLTGWGQPLQQVGVQAGPAQQDVVQHAAYGGDPTVSRTYLPLPISSSTKGSGLYETDPVGKLNAYYGSSFSESQPYAVTQAEASPLGRPISQAPAGSVWASHANQVTYTTNSVQDGVRQWSGLDASNVYAAGQLTKQVLTDADARRTEIYQDGLGRVILQRKITGYGGASPQNVDTYSVYAAAGYLQYTVPPAAVAAMAAGGTWNVANMPAGFANLWLYQYTYDDRGRLVERRFPGTAPVYMVYDQFDRPILVQDGNHRASQQWLFTKFDAQNRAVVSGLYYYNNQASTARQDLQALADNSALTTGYESRNNGGYTTSQTFPVVVENSGNGTVLLSTMFFDDYDLDADGRADYAYSGTQELGGSAPQPVPTSQLRGLQTMTRVRVVQPGGQYGNWLTSALFYDQYGNLIQQQSNNLLQASGGLSNVTTLVYREQGFVPQVLRSLKKQQTPDLPGNFSPTVQVRTRFRYDAGGLLLQTWQQQQWKNAWEPEVLVATNTYTDLGQVARKHLHSRYGNKYLQTQDFTYNLHGQLQRINSPNNLPVSNAENDLFALEIIREQADGLGNVPRYDGGISAVTWFAHNAAQTNQPERQRSYRFLYDGLGRLKDALYQARSKPWLSFTEEQGAYDEKNIGYDLNGNITGLQRYSKVSDAATTTLTDNLSFTYTGTGNQHSKVDDTGDMTAGFKDARTTQEYAYDPNGSITRDDNKGVTYTYNALNKVEKQVVGTGALNYTYDATGTLLKKETVRGGMTGMTEYYIDGLVYQSYLNYAGLLSVPTAEGRALVTDKTASRLTYEYHLRDHLGNLRVAFRAQPGTEDLKLSSEANENDGEYPNFSGISDTRSTDVSPPPMGGSYVASVASELSSGVSGPSIAIPVAHQDHIKVRVYYKTPYGVQYYRPAPAPTRAASAATIAWAVAPTLLPLPASPEHPARPTPGIQLSMTGLLGHLFAKSHKVTALPVAKPAQVPPLDAYVQWTLTNASGQVLRTGRTTAPVTQQSQVDWAPLDLPLDIDLSSEEARTGTLTIQEMNDGTQPVYFDSLTITHPQDRALVTQEQHYYPFGMALSGVAVNTIPQVPNVSKDQYNDGSALQDDLLGAEGGLYSTFFRTYDPATGRFTGVDPLADSYADQTLYQFGNNDPVNFNDPSGALVQNTFVNGRLMNPRGINGERSWTGTDYDQLYESSGSGGNSGIDNTYFRITAYGVNTIKDSEGNETNAYYWATLTVDNSYQVGTLPSYVDMVLNYPWDIKKGIPYEMPANDVIALIGGKVAELATQDPDNWQNACALRMSLALNRSGVPIPYMKGQTVKGADGNNYIPSAINMFSFLNRYFGDPTLERTNNDVSGSFPFLGRTGIYAIVPKDPSAFGATGHISLFVNCMCASGRDHCYANMPGGFKSLSLWQLK